MNLIKDMYKNFKNSFLLVIFCTLTFLGCSEEVIAPQIQQNILGLWGLREQTGTAPAVCDGEKAQFNDNGIAVFQCPGFEGVQTEYSAVNDVLTFTETNVQYSIEKPTDTNLVLTGINIDKTLKYGREF
jgi:hypothetical protein